MEGKTLSQIIKEDLIEHATNYAKTYREAYSQAKQIDHITVECAVCGKPLVIKSTDPEWDRVLDALKWRYFRHPECTPRNVLDQALDRLDKGTNGW